MAPGLADRILGHLEDLGLLGPGSVILDPMGGVGSTAIAACLRGHRAVTVELERRFIALSRLNRRYVRRRIWRDLDWTILQGDARNLSTLLAGAGFTTVMSPPYSDSEGQPSLGSVNKDGWGTDGKDIVARRGLTGSYGQTPGQIGNLRDRPLTVMSPPYANRVDDHGKDSPEWDGFSDRFGHYGTSAGQIGALRDRPVTLTSPPYEDSNLRRSDDWVDGETFGGPNSQVRRLDYGSTDGQLGQERGESYMQAMAQVYAEIAKVSDVCVTVTKDPTRDNKLRLLGEDTKRLLEAAGYTIVCHHRAILFEEQETADLFGGTSKKPRGRLGFFKRLQYQKGAPVAAWEDVLIGVKGEALPMALVTP